MARRSGQRQTAGPVGRRIPRRSKGHAVANSGAIAEGRSRCAAQRQRIAYETARILVDLGGSEFDRARRKAAARLGVEDKRCWPDNEEIQSALLEQQRLFHADDRGQTLAALRQQALAAMRLFAAFEPRLVGQTLEGTATREQGVELWLFADSVEEVVMELLERGIPWQQHDDQFRYAGGGAQMHPVLTFIAGDLPVSLVILPRQARHNPPLSPVSERPERGIGEDQLRRLIAAALR
jgi:hypothetical protein